VGEKSKRGGTERGRREPTRGAKIESGGGDNKKQKGRKGRRKGRPWVRVKEGGWEGERRKQSGAGSVRPTRLEGEGGEVKEASGEGGGVTKYMKTNEDKGGLDRGQIGGEKRIATGRREETKTQKGRGSEGGRG